jgi:hypothetical protein
MMYLTVWRDDLVKKDSNTAFVLLGVPLGTWMIFGGNKPLPLGSPKHSVTRKTYPTDYVVFVNTCTSEAVVTFNVTLLTLTADQFRCLKLRRPSTQLTLPCLKKRHCQRGDVKYQHCSTIWYTFSMQT